MEDGVFERKETDSWIKGSTKYDYEIWRKKQVILKIPTHIEDVSAEHDAGHLKFGFLSLFFK